MRRWLVILSFVVMQCQDLAAASTRSPDVPLWKRLLTALTPAARPVHHEQARPSTSVAAPTSPAPPSEPPIHEPQAKSTGADSGCNGGQRVISAHYWQGQHTASGQPFDPNGLTAAHRTLPFGTRLTVTNPRTGQSVTVVVNDRGPFISGVSLDLSLGAARAIGMRGVGAVCIS